MDKLRVLQVVQHLRPGGIETMTLDLLNKSSAQTEVHIMCLEGSRKQTLASWPRLHPVAHRLHFLDKKPKVDFPAVARLVLLIKKLKIDVVHSHHIGPLIYGGIAAKISGIKHMVHTEHDAWHLNNTKRRHLQNLIAHVVKPVIVADADLVAQSLRQFIPSISPEIIHNGVDVDKFAPGNKRQARKKLGLPQNVNLIGCAARLETVKGHSYLLKAMNFIPDTIHLALAGDGSLRIPLEELVRSYGLTKRVHFLGSIDDMEAFHNAIDVFCLASEQEGLPLSPLEAQASGVPVVLTDVGGCREAICPDTGRLVTAKSPTELAEALKKALQCTDKETPREFVIQHRNLDQTIKAYEALYGI